MKKLLGLIFIISLFLIFPIMGIWKNLSEALSPFPDVSSTIEISGKLGYVEQGRCEGGKYAGLSYHCGEVLFQIEGYGPYRFMVKNDLIDDIEEVKAPLEQNVTIRVNQSQLKDAHTNIQSGNAPFGQDIEAYGLQAGNTIYFSRFNDEGKKRFSKSRMLNWIYMTMWTITACLIILWLTMSIKAKLKERASIK